jgi:2-polyprenyl-3-methyl-5-hydroxy-6-metoxy-1,4-benzoquinol methylase
MSGPYEQIDPWGYTTPWGSTHLRVTAELLDGERSGAPFSRAFEVGCGEGFVTELLAARCESVLATDVVPAALERASQRLSGRQHVRFQTWDLLRDPAPGRYDLVVVMGVLECFTRRREFRSSRREILEMLEPGGYLLVTTTLQHPVVERSRWARWLLRGSEAIHGFLMASGQLTLCRSGSTPTHRFTLYRKSGHSQERTAAS